METHEQINLQVAAIAGWTDISEWNPSPKDDKPVKVYQGTNLAHPELGKFVPKYTESIDAIIPLIDSLKIYPVIDFTNDFVSYDDRPDLVFSFAKISEVAIALCELLLAINPEPIAPKITVIDDDCEIDKPSVFEVEFV